MLYRIAADATLVFEREFDGTVIRCAIHKGKEPVTLELPRPARDLWTGETVPAGPLVVSSNNFRLVKF